MATASYPSTRTRDVTTLVGTVRLYARRIDTVDAVHFDSQFGRGMVSSVEMTMLDLASGVESKRWPIGGFDIAEAIRLLAAQSDWELVQDLAEHRRRAAAFTSVRRMGLGPE